MNADTPMVSIRCITYNHEPYIRQCLEGFVMQKTNFKFEAIVHDDASTDHTADIIREYAAKYPDIIKPIYETENQYSKHDGSLRRIMDAACTGKYIALCEGDDYWIDPLKLQKQVDAMEQHPELDICAHGADHMEDGKLVKKVMPSKENTILTTEEVIAGHGRHLVATASLLYRRTLDDNMPEFRKNLSLDYTLQIHGALRGGMLYLSDVMSVYRYLNLGSWTYRIENGGFEKRQAFNMKAINMLNCLDRETCFKYTKAIYTAIVKYQFPICDHTGDFSCIREKYSDGLSELSFKQKIKMRVFSIPFIGRFFWKLRNWKVRNCHRSNTRCF